MSDPWARTNGRSDSFVYGGSLRWICGRRQLETDQEHRIAIETDIQCREGRECSTEQTGSDEEDQRERDLSGDQRTADADATLGRRSAVFSNGIDGWRSRGAQRRRGAEEQCHGYRQRRRKGQNTPVQVRVKEHHVRLR